MQGSFHHAGELGLSPASVLRDDGPTMADGRTLTRPPQQPPQEARAQPTSQKGQKGQKGQGSQATPASFPVLRPCLPLRTSDTKRISSYNLQLPQQAPTGGFLKASFFLPIKLPHSSACFCVPALSKWLVCSHLCGLYLFPQYRPYVLLFKRRIGAMRVVRPMETGTLIGGANTTTDTGGIHT